MVHSGSVIGAKSIVTKNVPTNSLSVGARARVLKRNISFSRQNTVRHSATHFDNLGKPTLFPEGHMPNTVLMAALRQLAGEMRAK